MCSRGGAWGGGEAGWQREAGDKALHQGKSAVGLVPKSGPRRAACSGCKPGDGQSEKPGRKVPGRDPPLGKSTTATAKQSCVGAPGRETNAVLRAVLTIGRWYSLFSFIPLAFVSEHCAQCWGMVLKTATLPSCDQEPETGRQADRQGSP